MRRLLWRNLKGDAAPHLRKKFRFKKFRKDCCGCVAFYGGTLKAMPHRTYQKIKNDADYENQHRL